MIPKPITNAAELKPGDPIRIVLTDGTVYDHVVQVVDGDTITTHLPVAAVQYGVYDEWPDPDPDDLTRAQLAETDPMLSAVAEALDEWLWKEHQVASSSHGAGHFWTLLHERGYRVVPNEPMPDLAGLLPPSTD